MVNNGGPGSIDAMSVITNVSMELSEHNFQTYLDLKKNGSISGLEGMSGKSLAIEMAAFEQGVAQDLLDRELSNYNTSDKLDIIHNVNERFNGSWDRGVGRRGPLDYISNTIRVLDRQYPYQNFDFTNRDHRFGLAVGLINDQYERKSQ